jgi:hypothetical protein
MFPKQSVSAEYYYKPSDDLHEIVTLQNPILGSMLVEKCSERELNFLYSCIRETINDSEDIRNGLCQRKIATPYIILFDYPDIIDSQHIFKCIVADSNESCLMYSNGVKSFNWDGIAFCRDECAKYIRIYSGMLPSLFDALNSKQNIANNLILSNNIFNNNSNNDYCGKVINHDITNIGGTSDGQHNRDIEGIARYFLTFLKRYDKKTLNEEEFTNEIIGPSYFVSRAGAKQAWKWVPTEYTRKKGRPRTVKASPNNSSEPDE